MKQCGNCKHSGWIRTRESITETCIDCRYVSVNGVKEPSNWEPKPNTNADHIRSVSDEKLAEFLVDAGWDCHNCREYERLDNEPLFRWEKCDAECATHCLEWLKQPVEEV